MWPLDAIGRLCAFESGLEYDDMLSKCERNSSPQLQESCVLRGESWLNEGATLLGAHEV